MGIDVAGLVLVVLCLPLSGMGTARVAEKGRSTPGVFGIGYETPPNSLNGNNAIEENNGAIAVREGFIKGTPFLTAIGCGGQRNGRAGL